MTATDRLTAPMCRTCGESRVSHHGATCTLCEMATPYGQPVTAPHHRPATDAIADAMARRLTDADLCLYTDLFQAWVCDTGAVESAFRRGTLTYTQHQRRCEALDARFNARLAERGWTAGQVAVLESRRQQAEEQASRAAEEQASPAPTAVQVAAELWLGKLVRILPSSGQYSEGSHNTGLVCRVEAYEGDESCPDVWVDLGSMEVSVLPEDLEVA